MAKKYNLNNSSDMKRFERDLTGKIQNMSSDFLNDRTFSVTCPHCHSQIQVSPGKGVCPFCGNEIDLKLNIHF